MLPLIKILTTGLLSVSFVILIRRLKVRLLGQRWPPRYAEKASGWAEWTLTRSHTPVGEGLQEGLWASPCVRFSIFSRASGPGTALTIAQSMNLRFLQGVLIEHLLYAKLCSRHWEYSRNPTRFWLSWEIVQDELACSAEIDADPEKARLDTGWEVGWIRRLIGVVHCHVSNSGSLCQSAGSSAGCSVMT